MLQQLLLLSSYTDTEQVPSQACVMKAFFISHALSHSERPHQSHVCFPTGYFGREDEAPLICNEVASPPSPRPLSSSLLGDAKRSSIEYEPSTR